MQRLAFALVLLVCAPVLAADDAVARAKSHFKQGAAHYATAQFVQALQEYQAAYAIMPLPDILFNIGQARRMLGEKRLAVDDYRRYLAAEPNGLAAAEARKHVAELTAALERERVATEKADAEKAAAEKLAAEKSAAEKSAHDKSAADKAAVDKAAVAKPAAEKNRSGAKLVAGITFGVVGVGAMVAGGALLGLAQQANDDFLHPADGVYSPEAESNRRSFSTSGVVLLAVGGAAVVVAIPLLVVAQRETLRSALKISANW